MSEIESIFGSKARNALIHAEAILWGRNPFVLGGFASARPGCIRIVRACVNPFRTISSLPAKPQAEWSGQPSRARTKKAFASPRTSAHSSDRTRNIKLEFDHGGYNHENEKMGGAFLDLVLALR